MNPENSNWSTTDLWLRKLCPDPHAEVPRPASRPDTVANAIEHLGRGPIEWALQVGHAMTTHIISEVPEFQGGADEFETMRMGPESSVIRALMRFSLAEDDLPAITAEAIQGDVDFVRRGIPLDRVLRGVRLGHAAMTKAFLDACSSLVPEEERASHMQFVSESLFRFIDEFSAGMADTFLAERERWTVSAAAARTETARHVLDEVLTDEHAASQELGYDLSHCHLALTLWFDPPRNTTDTPELEMAARDAFSRLRATKTLIMSVGGGKVWGWGWGSWTRSSPPSSLLNYDSGHDDIRLAAGTPATGIQGFRKSHQEAKSAEQTARLGMLSDGWATRYADVAIPSMLSADLSLASDFVLRELGPLANDTASVQDLRATVLCYLEEESSPHAAAQRLYVSRNTVAYRVKRAGELLGYNVADRRFELQTALLLAKIFGPRVLKQPS